MKRIISVSRRTDIPAFYGDWFMQRLADGFAGYVNPFGGQKYLVALKPENVVAFVFWSKNFEPFIPDLRAIHDLGYRFYFNYTITGLPDIFECNLVETEIAVKALKGLSRMYSPGHINWRYDPIVVSDITDYDYHRKRFRELARMLEGHTERCIISFAKQYGKVQRNFDKFRKQTGIAVHDPPIVDRLELATELAQIASQHGIRMMSCCSDYLIRGGIEKAHCVDGEVIEELFHPAGFSHKRKPTRKECGCTESTDIGAYDTCPHGCIYCYANANKEVAMKRYGEHDPRSVFLGYSKAQSDQWMEELKQDCAEPIDNAQMELF